MEGASCAHPLRAKLTEKVGAHYQRPNRRAAPEPLRYALKEQRRGSTAGPGGGAPRLIDCDRAIL
jgi:hypothetical protein